MDRCNKKNILKTFIIIITFLFIPAEVNCDIIPLINLSAGDVINGIDLKNDTCEIVGKLFDDNMMSKYVERDNTLGNSLEIDDEKSVFYHCISYSRGKQSDFNTKIKVINERQKIINRSDYLNRNFLGINGSYAVNKNYTCVKTKTCRVKGRETVTINLMNGHNVPEDVKQLANETGVFKMRREKKTYYVSSILKGYCLYQLLIFKVPESPTRRVDAEKDNPVYISKIYVPNNNKTLETWISNYLNDAHQTLYNISPENKKTIFNQIHNETVIDLKLELLPALPPQ
ncbi:uncharacterized protein LOC130674496 [Microplitis mediator]|uniref:uncharacterized protein LOC130674496 n=1 Tax=Microplitis mediator TaxID=375433 RepID=UPI00255477E8|nr:uncharacterized protein LOC130674496 [Microplitis mediator]